MAQQYGYNSPPSYQPYQPSAPVAPQTQAGVRGAANMGGGGGKPFPGAPQPDQEIANYQKQQALLAQQYASMSGLQNQLNQMLQANPGQDLYQQLLGLYNPNIGAAANQQLLDLNKPVNQQSTGSYFVGY